MLGRGSFLQIFVAVLALIAAVALGSCASLTARDDGPAVIHLVRHAEKQLGRDPGLTTDGETRAQDLIDALSSAPIEVVYSTDYKRSRDTAAPIALSRNLPIIYYDPSDLEAFAAKLLSEGRSVLVVGHSNTTPDLVAALGGDAGEPITEATEYDRLYRLILGPEISSTILRFGTPTPR